MQLLLAERLEKPRSLTATVVSAALHAGAVIVLVLSGQQVVESVRALIEQTVQYLYPVPRDLGPLRPGLANEAPMRGERGFGAMAPQTTNPANGDARAAGLAHGGVDFAPDPSNAETVEPGIGDNAFSALEVDSVAAFDPTSAAPEYPAVLALRRVEGVAVFRFVVDSTGTVDMTTVRVMSSTHKLFAQAVLDAMPRMRFRPARVANSPVRLLVEQAFMFKIQRAKGQIS